MKNTDDIQEYININTSNQFEQKIWKSSSWMQAANVGPFAIGGFFLFVGLIVSGEKRDADMAPLMFLISIICFMTFIPWRKFAKTLMKAGIDPQTNTLWITKDKKGIVGYETEINDIIELSIQKYISRQDNPIWFLYPGTPLNFNEKEWLLKVARKDNKFLWTFKGISFATKKEALAITNKLNKLLGNHKKYEQKS